MCGPNHGAASVAYTSVPDLVGLARDGTDAQKERAAGALKVFETAEAEAATKVRAYLRSTRAMYRCRHVRMRMHARAYACLDAPGCAHADCVCVRASARARVRACICAACARAPLRMPLPSIPPVR